MRKLEIKKGDKYNKLVIIKETKKHILPCGRKQRVFLCKCDCGNTTKVFLTSLRKENTKSCGCLRKEVSAAIHKTHGLRWKRDYPIWNSMIQRCHNKNHKQYKDYGGRGIKICDRWLSSPENFFKDMGECPKGLTLDRVNNNGNYYKENCRWTSRTKQALNRRNNHYMTLKGKTLTISQWTEKLGFRGSTIYSRIKAGWSIEKTLTTPIK